MVWRICVTCVFFHPDARLAVGVVLSQFALGAALQLSKLSTAATAYLVGDGGTACKLAS